MNVPRRQHYVWRRHLSEWEVDGKIAVLRKGANGFLANPVNVAVERDFYRLPRLTPEDHKFLEGFIDSLQFPEDVKDLARGWADPVVLVDELRSFLAAGGVTLSPDAQRVLDDFEIEIEEKYHAKIEGDALKSMEQLRAGDSSFWADDGSAIEFSYFISVQYFRTKRMADVIVNGFETEADREKMARLWPIIRHILATSLGVSLYMERARWRFRLIEPAGSTLFITADQPIINLMSAEKRNDMALYFPLGPKRALLIEHEENEGVAGEDALVGDQLVDRLNRRIFDYAHEQAFASDLTYLQCLAEFP